MQQVNIMYDFNLQIEMSYYYELFWHYRKLQVQDLIERFDLQESSISAKKIVLVEHAFINMAATNYRCTFSFRFKRPDESLVSAILSIFQ